MSELLLAYASLGFLTVAIAAMTVANWRRFRGVEHLVMGALFYYYALFGAWKVLALKRGVGQSDALDHLEQSLFSIQIDGAYLGTIWLYGIFVLLLLVGIWRMPQRLLTARASASSLQAAVSRASVGRLIVVSALALGLSMAALGAEILSALDQGVPIYLLTRTEVSAWFSVHQLLNRVGLAALSCAWPVHLLARSPVRGSIVATALLATLTIAWLLYLGALGNRNELVVAFLGGLYFYALLGGNVRWTRLATAGFVVYVVLRLIESLRAVPPEFLASRISELFFDPAFWDPTVTAEGSESLAAHISLYGIIVKNLPFTWGSSVVYLLQSLLPFYPADARVTDSYQIYAHAVGAPEGQGFNIHFAAGAYLNFGVVGVIGASIVLATVFNGLRTLTFRRAPAALRVPTLLGYAFLCAFLPIAMRAGPEGLKAIVLEGYVLPLLVCWLSIRRDPDVLRSRSASSALRAR